MAREYLKQTFENFNPVSFPDLTGLSTAARSSLTGSFAHKGDLRTLHIGRDVTDNTVHSLFLAATARVYSLYSAEEDLCIGYGSTNKNYAFPLRLKLNSNDTTLDLLSQTEHAVGQAIQLGNLSEEELLSLLSTADATSFDIACVIFRNDEKVELPTTGVVLAVEYLLDLTDQELHYNVTLQCQRYAPAFSKARISKIDMTGSSLMLENSARHLLGAFNLSVDHLCSATPINAMSWPESDEVLRSISNPSPEQLNPKFGHLVHSAFEYHATQTPERKALDFLEPDLKRTRWSFGELNSIGDQIASRLQQEFNVGIEDSVPICIPRSPAFYACVLAVLKSGACFTPFANSPHERKKLMAEELHPVVVLTMGDEDTSWWEGPTLNVSSFLEAPAINNVTLSTRKPSLRPNGSNLVYKMYTSGSTGRPKAVSLEHRNAVQTVAASRDLVKWTCRSRILQYAAPSFDMCYYDIFLAWYLGVCLCSASDQQIYDDLASVVNILEATSMGLTPSVAQTLDPQAFPGLDWLYCIGEPMTQSLADSWQGRMFNSYGPTEAAQMVTLFPVHRNVRASVIGQPFKNTTFLIAHKHTNEIVPVFGVGELWIGGYQIAREYYANLTKTEAAFIERGNDRFYKTGDQVRMLDNGTFEFIGRTDDQVKIRGQRVELGEINQVIKQAHPGIKEVATQFLKPVADSKEQLVTFIVMGSDTCDLDSQDRICDIIGRAAEEMLPPYMIPKIYEFIERVPLSQSRKIDKRKLGTIVQDRMRNRGHSTQGNDSDNLSHVENAIIETLWQTTKIPKRNLRHHTSFYHMGIDSIGAIRMASILGELGYKVKASEVLAHPNIRSLSSYLTTRAESSTLFTEQSTFDFQEFDEKHRPEVLSQIAPKEYSDATLLCVRPCTAMQIGMVAQSLHSQGGMYFNHLRCTLPAAVDRERLCRAFQYLAEQHEMLRTGFAHLDQSEQQFAMLTYSAESCSDNLQFADGKAYDVIAWQREMSKTCINALHRPQWRALVTADSLYFSAHHALYDAETLEIFMQDLDKAYRQQTLPPSVSIEPHLSRIVLGNLDREHTSSEYWARYKGQITPTKFPMLRSTTTRLQTHGMQALQATSSLIDLESNCKRLGVTIQALGQAAWAKLLAAYTGDSQVCFGTVRSGRDSAESAALAFPCLTTVPTYVNTDSDNLDVLNDLVASNAEMHDHQFLPIRSIQRACGYPEESLFDTIFTLQKAVPACDHDSFKVQYNVLHIDYPLSIELEPTKDQTIMFRLFYSHSHLPDNQASLILEQYNCIIEELMLEDTTEKHSAYLDEARDQRILSFNPAAVDNLPSDVRLLHEFVESSAQTYGQRPALEFITERSTNSIKRFAWSFAELDAIGNQVANYLRSKSIPQGSVVATCYEKCPEASFAMLGILKAGHAYLAIDPGAPSERKRFILRDAQVAVVLTDGRSELPSLDGLCAYDLCHSGYDKMSAAPVRLERPIRPDDTSYCLYTSGTTGTPKGCILTHSNAVQALLNFQKLYRWTSNSRWLQFASYHFDVSVMEQYWSWSVGICMVSANRDLILEDLPGFINDLKITHIDLTPSLARLLDPNRVPTLASGVFVTGGELLKREIVTNWGPTKALYNAYGPTEVTIGCTMNPSVSEEDRPSNIGKQFPTVGTFVVDPADPSKLVFRGAVGELCVFGNLVAKGYMNRPELNETKFINIRGRRSYRTGDLVRVLCDGKFEFVGRADDQVKLRGQRLEFGEINSVIKDNSANVDDVFTQVLKHPLQQNEQLVSFVVLRGGHGAKSIPSIISDRRTLKILPQLRKECTNRLPVYMVPTHILLVTSLPLSVNNKVDGKACKALYDECSLESLQTFSRQSSLTNSHEVPQELRTLIVGALSTYTNSNDEPIRDSTSFFQLGLDSISIIGFTRTLRAKGLKEASHALIMRNPSIETLAAAIASNGLEQRYEEDALAFTTKHLIAATSHRFKNHAAQRLEVASSRIELVTPCTPLQQGIISRAQSSSNGIYFNAFHFDLSPDIKVSQLKHAFTKLIRACPILRTAFVPTNDGYVQAIMTDLTDWWRNIDLKDCIFDTQAGLQRSKWIQNNQDVIRSPLEVIIWQSGDRSIMTIHLFHACYDGYSFDLMLRHLHDEYQGYHDVSYGPNFFEVLPRGPLRPSPHAEKFWTEHLTHKDQTRNIESSASGEEMPHTKTEMHIRLEETFEKCRRTLSVTHQAIIQACWSILLQTTFSSSMVTGIVVSGRANDIDDVDMVVGPLFNTVPFHLQVTKGAQWQDVILESHDFNTKLIPFQHTPLRDIQRFCQNFSTDNLTSLLESLLVFQKTMKADDFSNSPWTLREDSAITDFPIALDVEQVSDDTLKCTLVVQDGVLGTISSEDFLNRFADIIRHATQNSPSLISETIDTSSFEMLQETEWNSRVMHTVKTKESFGEDLPEIVSANQSTEEFYRVRDEVSALAGIDSNLISTSTSILELGLDSIDAVKLSARLRTNAGLKISVSSIMQALTVHRISQNAIKLGEEKKPQHDQDRIKFDALSKSLEDNLASVEFDYAIESIFPCTPLQEGMLAEMVQSSFTRYFNHDILILQDQTDLDRLIRAWQMVVNKCSILRTVFVPVEQADIPSSFAGAIMEPHDFQIGYKHNVPENAWQEVLTEIRNQVLECYSRRPPIFLTVVTMRGCKDPSHIILSLPHAMYDGWSLGLLHADLEKAYHTSIPTRPGGRDVLQRLLASDSAANEAYWRELLANVHPTIVSRLNDGDEVSQKSKDSEMQSCHRVSELTLTAKNMGCTVSVLLQASWSCLLAYLVKDLDVVFARVISGRDDEVLNDAMFPTMNTVLTRSLLHGTRRELARYTQQSNALTSEHQHFPLRKSLGFARSCGSNDIFNTLFVYQKRPELDSNPGSLYKSIESASAVEYPLCVEAEITGDKLIWRVASNDGYVGDPSSYAENLDKILEAFIQKPDELVFDSKDGKISICDLPGFVPSKVEMKQTDSNYVQRDYDESDKWSTEEITLRSVIADIAQIDSAEVHRDSRITQLGLDSIVCIKLSAALRRESIQLSVNELMRLGSIQNMAQHLKEQSTASQSSVPDLSDGAYEAMSARVRNIRGELDLDSIGVSAQDIESILPATPGQIFFLSRWQTTGAFFQTLHFQVRGPCKMQDVTAAYNGLIHRLPILRTAFVATGDVDIPVVQVVLQNTTGRIKACSSYQALVEELSHANQQGSTGCPAPFQMFSADDDGCMHVIFRLSHALYDGISMPLILDVFNSYLYGDVSPQPDGKNEREWSDFIARSLYQPATMREFWKTYFDGIPKTSLRGHDESDSFTRNHIVKAKALEELGDLQLIVRQRGISLQAIVIGAIAVQRSQMVNKSGLQDVCVGVYGASRDFGEADQLPYPTINFIPIRVRLHDGISLAKVANQIQDDLRFISERGFGSVGMWELKEWVGEYFKCDTWINVLREATTKDDEHSQAIIPFARDGSVEETIKCQQVDQDPSYGLFLEHNAVKHSYEQAVDIEATIFPTYLDLSVMAPQGMLDMAESSAVIDGVVSILRAAKC